MESNQPKLPGFDDEIETPPNPSPESAPPVEDAKYAAVVAGRVAAAEGLREPTPHQFPIDEDGKFIVDEIKPGMSESGWGIVTGRYDGPVEIDITHSPRKVPAAQRPIAAVRHYARLVNSKMDAIERRDAESVQRLERKIQDWLKWTLDPGFGKALRKPFED